MSPNEEGGLAPALVSTGSGSDRVEATQVGISPVGITQVGISHSEEGGLVPALVSTGGGSDQVTVNNPQNQDAIRLHPKPHLSELAVKDVVQQTENFSFAYMKELFLSATMQWMSTRAETLNLNHNCGASMDEIILDQAVRLRAQMTRHEASTVAAGSSASAGAIPRALAAVRRFHRLQ